jgi:DNA repair protein RadA/Sms
MAPAASDKCEKLHPELLFWTKKYHIPVFLNGHITKDGAIAGPKALEHIVDTVLYFEGPRNIHSGSFATIKNRFWARE